MRKMVFQFSKKNKNKKTKKKNNEMIFFFSMEYHVYWLLKNSCFEMFGEGKYSLFSSQKVDENMISIEYWKVLVLQFWEMGNMVFFRGKKLMERWYLRITEKFLFWIFRRWKIRCFFQPKIDEKMIFNRSF